MLGKLLARNLRRPEGLLGVLVGQQMNRTNREMNRAAVASLAPADGERVLEIGFGGGTNFVPLAERIGTGRIVGLDYSELMYRLAARKVPGLIANGRVALVQGDAESLPFEDDDFARALTVNTLYFWHNPDRVMAEVRRVLRPGGKLLIAYRPRDVMKRYPFTRYGFTMYSDEEVYSLFSEAGFSEIRFERGDDDQIGYVCASGRKPG